VSACTRAEQCNSCDDDADGLVDEGLVACYGVTCGDTFETCGDGLDNDCDGAADEGCSTCTGTPGAFPYTFSTFNELRRDSMNSQTYGKFMDAAWNLIPSHRVNQLGLRFGTFDVEQGYDYFYLNGTGWTGRMSVLPFSTGLFGVGAPNPASLRFYTDYSIQYSGVATTHVEATCHNGGGKTFYNLDLNKGADGVLLHPNDNAYVMFYLPAGREAFVNLEHGFNGSSQDFDVYATVGATSLFGTSCSNSPWCAVNRGTTGEAFHIAPDGGTGRYIKLNIHAYQGAGRFRVFVASPVASFSNDVDIAYDGNYAAGSPEDVRIKSIWGQAQRMMLEATDGQYRIKPGAYVTRDVSCFSCYDIVFSDNPTVSGCSGGLTTVSIGGRYIEIPGPYWRGQDWWVDGRQCNAGASTQRVGQTVVHEWGHYAFDLCDEYGGTAVWCNPSGSGDRCGFSLMGASEKAAGHFEFCADGNHAKDPLPGQEPAGWGSSWAGMVSKHPQFTVPQGTPDFTKLKTLGQQMEAGHHVWFNGP
jgi:hypothetical protein